jgi:uncharacterized protein YyaL (SSP411 family)
MAHESFENLDVARLMNERFINIKVDRQERPDVDEIYQKVTQMMGQGGGWPLTVFMTPRGEPFFGGTYFPPEDRYGRPGFVGLLLGLSEAWKTQRDELHGNVEQFLHGYEVLEGRLSAGGAPDGDDVPLEAARFFAENTDPRHGGLGGAAKNPFGFAHLLAALDFMQRGPLEIVFAGDRAQPALLLLVETVHRTYQLSRVLAFADDVPVRPRARADRR